MDDRTFQLVLLGLSLGGAYLLYKKFVSSSGSTAGGAAGLLTDLVIGERAPNTESTVYQPPGTNTIPDPAKYFGAPVLGFFVNPKPGNIVRRQPFQGAYQVTVEAKNMTPDRITSTLTFEVREGSETVTTITEPVSLDPGERKQFQVMLNTNTVFGVSNATARVRLGGTWFAVCPYVIA